MMTSNVTVYLLLACCLGLGFFVVWLSVQRGRIQSELSEAKAKLLQREASAHETAQNRKTTKSKEAKPIPHESDITELRREAARLRDDLKKQKEETRRAEAGSKDKLEALQVSLETLELENKSLMDLIREKEQIAKASEQHRQQTLTSDRAETKKSNEEFANLQRRVQEMERRAKSDAEQNATLAQKLAAANSELAKWRDANKLADGKPLDPLMFKRWKERALEGRRMYQMMRYMRELSDEKLASYQDSVVVVCSELLKQLGQSVPSAKSGEVRSDKLLGATLGHLQEIGRIQPMDDGTTDVTAANH